MENKTCLRCHHIHTKKCGCGCEDALTDIENASEKTLEELMDKLPMTIGEHWDKYKAEYLTPSMPKPLRMAIKQAFYLGAFTLYGMTCHLADLQRRGLGDSNETWAKFRKEIDDF